VGAPLEGLIRSTRKMPLEIGLAVLMGMLIGSVVAVVVT
jgi:hypothetical protein